jgi:hypothetical protein
MRLLSILFLLTSFFIKTNNANIGRELQYGLGDYGSSVTDYSSSSSYSSDAGDSTSYSTDASESTDGTASYSSDAGSSNGDSSAYGADPSSSTDESPSLDKTLDTVAKSIKKVKGIVNNVKGIAKDVKTITKKNTLPKKIVVKKPFKKPTKNLRG